MIAARGGAKGDETELWRAIVAARRQSLPHHRPIAGDDGVPNGIRTRVFTVKG
jgi:hypothetical protein